MLVIRKGTRSLSSLPQSPFYHLKPPLPFRWDDATPSSLLPCLLQNEIGHSQMGRDFHPHSPVFQSLPNPAGPRLPAPRCQDPALLPTCECVVQSVLAT